MIVQNDLNASIYMSLITNKLKIKNYSSVHCLIMLYVHLREYSLKMGCGSVVELSCLA